MPRPNTRNSLTASDATSDTEAGSSSVLTPRSSSTASLPPGPTPGPDDVIPSVEGGDSDGIDPAASPSRGQRAATHDADALIRVGNLRLGDTVSPSPDPQVWDLSGVGAALVGITGSPSPGPAGRSRVPHSVRDEEPPKDRFHEPRFQAVFGEARDLMGSLARVLSSSDVHLEPDSMMRDLHGTAQRLAAFQCPPTRVIGLVGDSGVGKSSLLNSLLDCQNLASSTGDGVAVTCVVTEFRYREDDRFFIDVQHFSTDELKAQFTELVSSYRHHHLHAGEMDSAEDREHWETRSKVAVDTLGAMFRDKSIEALLRLPAASEEQIVATLLEWASEDGPGTDRVSYTVDTLGRCSDLLKSLTVVRNTELGTAEWPFIKSISVYLNAHILSKGLVLVDLPGLRDLNSARREITQRHLLECDEIFAVCPIDRAISNESLRDVVAMARQAKLSNVSIVCTKSDVLPDDPNEAKQRWEGGNPAEIASLVNVLSTARHGEEAVRRQLEDAEDSYGDEHPTVDRLTRHHRRASIRLEQEESRFQRYLIETRSRYVTANLQDKYRGEITGGHLRVFCAGNSLYWAYRNEVPKEKARPFLELSGILALRRHCMSIVSESQLRIAIGYLRGDVPNLLSQVRLWVQSGAGSAAAEQREGIRHTLDELEAGLRRDLTRHSSPVNTLGRKLVEGFDQRIYSRRNINRWRQGAIHAGQVWGGWHHSSYSAFCRQYGDYATPKVGRHNWNEEAMEVMVLDLEDPWEAQYTSIGAFGTEVMSVVARTMEWTVNLLEESGTNIDLMQPLLEALTSGQSLLVTNIEDAVTAFEINARTLRTMALSGLRTSIFGRAMEGSYRTANMESGTGSDARRKAAINSTLGDPAVFDDIMRQFRTDFRDLATEFQERVKAAVAERLDVVRGTLDIIRSENVARESERDPAFRREVAAEVERARAVMDRVKAVAEEAGQGGV